MDPKLIYINDIVLSFPPPDSGPLLRQTFQNDCHIADQAVSRNVIVNISVCT